MIKAYKSEQGRMVRMGAFWTLALLFLYGCMALNQTLYTFVDSLKSDMGQIPILGWSLTGAFVISTATFVIGFILLFRWHQTPKVADLLIETESELQKVTWAKMPEVINSSVVVIGFVLFLMAFLAGSDMVLSRIFDYILLGRTS
ncbi:MAG: preprotein translocase subunit SecE [Planctomycetota bacterium]|jgi:preprotein translocase SecE subunit|nr:preprotein translocase subunit SecE [Planctomycetota bacterium]